MIFTFYSFKGGVGRSMALANLAEVFHERGLRVLVVDWDLEAPGLEAYFGSGDAQGALSLGHPGLLDLLTKYRAEYPRLKSGQLAAAAAGMSSDPESYRRQLTELDNQTKELLNSLDSVPEYLRRAKREEPPPTDLRTFLRETYGEHRPSRSLPGRLATSPLAGYIQCVHPADEETENGVFLLAAGSRDGAHFAEYAEQVQELDWTDLYVSYDGRDYFSWFRDELKAVADVVLIDSRTGVTEMGGVCTRHLADAVVSFCAPNFQNVDGVVRVMSSVNKPSVKQARGDRHIDVLIIPTRIELSESDRLEKFSRDFAKRVEMSSEVPEEFSTLHRPLWNLQIPYIPRYNYEEQRVLGPDVLPPDAVGEKLAESYRRIALHLAVLGDSVADKRLRNAFAGDIAAQFPQLVPGVPRMMPPVPPSFVGRAREVATLTNELTGGHPEAGSFHVVCGPAGIGKTTLAAYVCHRFDPNAFPDGILWARAADLQTSEQAYDWLRAQFGEKRIGERALREKLKDRRFLLVVDDVRSLEDVRAALTFGEACARVLITRDLSLTAAPADATIVLEPWADAECREYFKDVDPAALAEVQPTPLGREFLRWPLAATLARREYEHLIALGRTPAGAVADLADLFRRHGIVAFDQRDGGRGTSVARTMREVIYGDAISPEARRTLVGIARGQVTSVPRGRLGSSMLEADVRQLLRYGLATRDADGELSVPPIVRAYLTTEGEIDDPSAAGWRPKSAVSSSEDRRNDVNPDVNRAKEVLRGAAMPLKDMQELAERLKDGRYFGYARQLFARARRHSEVASATAAVRLRLAQRHALCTYKDPDLPADERFNDALVILQQLDLNTAEPSQETLGQAGAIHKNMWRLAGRRRDLERSLMYYEAGFNRGLERDYGYTSINAAAVHDLLAGQQRDEAPDAAATHTSKAQAIRDAVVARLPPLLDQKEHAWLATEWWFYATMAEACFGLDRQDEARYWLRVGLPLNPPEWQLETLTRQLTEIAHAQGQPMNANSAAWRTLRLLTGHADEALRGITLGKVGLALSGGGFRASLFHIGVLARLAEADLLRYVEVLSCVSGGSIIGAHYYLEVRRLLNTTADRDVSRDDYIEIVKRIEERFLRAVQKNLRTRLFASVAANLRTLVEASYTRTDYLGRLFERHIFSTVDDDRKRALDELIITPPDNPGLNPKLDNWRRAAKAPILLLNATTLNTGHNWQFAVSWMGEPPLGASSPVDRNDLLRRMYYWEAPPEHKKMPLGRAVAASACVPALFDPVTLKGLFPNQIVRLVDGGVHDNQGVVGLLEQDCTVMLVSDASGQANLLPHPSGEVTSVPLRANNILMGRVREAEFRELEVLRRSSAIRGLVFLHLKKDLDVTQIDWVDSQDPWQPPNTAREPITTYGIPKTVQRLLAGIRTDLDSFTDREAYALMLSGYEMAGVELPAGLPQWTSPDKAPIQWQFKSIEPIVKREAGHDLPHAELLRQLAASGSRAGKIWKLSPSLTATAIISVLVLAAIAVMWRSIWVPMIPWRALRLGLGGYMAAAVLLVLLHRVARTGKSASVILTGLVMLPFGAIAAFLHLGIFDPLYLLKGAVDRQGRRAQTFRRIARAAIFVVVAVATLVALLQSSTLRSDRSDSGPPALAISNVVAQARVAQAARDYPTAIARWTEALAKDSRNTEALSARAHAYMQDGDPDRAAADYTAALAIRQSPEWLRGRAYAYKLLDRLDESRQDLSAALTIQRDERTLADIRYLDYIQSPPPGQTRASGRLYVLLATPLQEVALDPIRQRIREHMIIRPPGAGRNPPSQTELRYVFAGDRDQATALAERLKSLGIPIARVVSVPAGRARAGHFELWLSSDALAAAAN